MNQIDRAISDFSMLKRGGKIVVGLSGGADSITLIHYLKHGLNREVIACHINHNLRGEESQHDSRFVSLFCEKEEIPLFVKDADVEGYAKAESMSIEEAGRTIRYRFFEEIALSQQADYIATAHTLSDNAETVLLNLTRGTGLLGLCGIPPLRGKIIRPLIYCTRQDIEEYCRKNALDYVVDSSNLDSSYSRNNIRNNIIPVLKQINPSFEGTMGRNISIFKSDQDCLDRIARGIFARCKAVGGYQLALFSAEHEAIRHRVIGLIFNENNTSKSADVIVRIDGMIAAAKGKIILSGQKSAIVKNGFLEIVTEQEPLDYFEDPLILGEYCSRSGELYQILKCDVKNAEIIKKVYKNLLFLLLDYDRIKGITIIRQRRQGDKIEFSHRAHTRTLKKLFIEQKLSAYEKSKTLVISDEESVIAVFPQGVAKRVAVDETTKNLLAVVAVDLDVGALPQTSFKGLDPWG